MDIFSYSLWTALITPLKSDLSPDLDSLTRLIREQEESQLGLLVLGSTGESLNLSLAARKRIVEHCLSLSPTVPIIVGIPGHNLEATLSWLDYLETLPIDGYLMITPIYARPGDEGQYHWFKTLMDRAMRPVMLYNVPKRCGTALSRAAVERLAAHCNFWSIKDASGSVEQFSAYRQACAPKPVFCGDDGLFAQFASAGSPGLISVASNVWPRAVKIYVEQCIANTFTDRTLWDEACNELFKATNPVAVKRILFEEKRIASKAVMPPLSEHDFTDVSALIAASHAINTWSKRFV